MSLSPLRAEAPPPLYENEYVRLDFASHPLLPRSVDISLKKPISELNEEAFAELWKIRSVVERHFLDKGFSNRLCHLKLKKGLPFSCQIVPYPSLPKYLDYWLFRKIFSIWKQTVVAFRTIFPARQPSEKVLEKERAFWRDVDFKTPLRENDERTGRGKLTEEDTFDRQCVFPANEEDLASRKIAILHDYAPLRTGGKPMHVLLVSNPYWKEPCAKNFLELGKDEYVEEMLLTKKIALWAEKEFKEQGIVHIFDKTGKIAGQTMPSYHAHVIIVENESEEMWGKIAIFARMAFFSRHRLSPDVLEERVEKFKKAWAYFLDERDDSRLN